MICPKQKNLEKSLHTTSSSYILENLFSLNFSVTQRHMNSLFNYCNCIYFPFSYNLPVFMGAIYTAHMQKQTTIHRELII